MAQNFLGAYFASGFEIEPNYKQAVFWYSKAVKAGHTHAKWNLGTMLLNGEGVKANIKLAIQVILDAAQDGQPGATSFMSYVYREGEYGVVMSEEHANYFEEKFNNYEEFKEFGKSIDLDQWIDNNQTGEGNEQK